MIVIIGSGLAGLTAAKVLKENSQDFLLLESSSTVGGRVKSDVVDGFILDHGFQVLLDSYKQVKKHLDIDALELCSFSPGANIYLSPRKKTIMSDPMRDPGKALSTLMSPLTTFSDAIRTLFLKVKSEKRDITSFDYLKELGFSDKYIDGFFKPFFSGIFLERELRSPANYFSFLFNRFSKGLATLPKNGMGEVTASLAKISEKHIRLNYHVSKVEKKDDGIYIFEKSGEMIKCDQVILAVDAPAALKIFPKLPTTTKKRSVTTVYFKAKKLPNDSEYLLLNGSGEGRVNHIAFLSKVNPNYAPKSEHLISVNVLDCDEVDPYEILREIKEWDISLGHDWKHIATYPIYYAQPDEFSQGEEMDISDNILIAGDYTQTPSIDGAMLSGEQAAIKILNLDTV